MNDIKKIKYILLCDNDVQPFAISEVLLGKTSLGIVKKLSKS